MAQALPAHADAPVVAVIGACKLSAVFSGVALLTFAGTVHAKSAVIAVIRTNQFGTVKACPRLVADALVVDTAAPAQTVIETIGLTTVFSKETLLTHARAINTVAVVTTVHQADLNATVDSTKSIKTVTFALHTSALILAVIWAVGFRTVRTPPARLTKAAAGVGAPVSTTIAVRFCGQFTLGEVNVEQRLFENVRLRAKTVRMEKDLGRT